MRQLFLIMFFFTLAVSGYSQKCDEGLYINETDPIKNEKHLKTKYFSYKMGMSENYTFSLELLNKKVNLICTSTDPKVNGYNDEIGILFTDKTSQLIKFENSYETKTELGQSIYHNTYQLSLEMVEKFSSVGIESIKHYSTTRDFELKSKKTEKFMEYAKCFLSNIDETKDLESKEKDGKVTFEDPSSIIPSYYKPCNITVDEIDEFEGYRRKELKYAGIAKPTEKSFPLFVYLKSYDGRLWMTAELDAISYCLNSDSKLNFKLENNTIVRLSHMGDIDCGKRSTFKVKLTEAEKEQLKSSPISLIRLETADGFIDIEYIQIKNYFIENIDCI